jgi:hypothetical protein
LLFPSFPFQEHKRIPLMMLEDGLLGALCLGGGGWEDGWRTICLDTVAGGLDGDCIDTVGSSREERDGLVDGTGIATVGLDTVAGLDSIGLDSIDLDLVGSSREEGAGLVDGGLADAHGGRVSCCLDPSLFGTVSMDFSALGVVLMLHNLTQY